MTRETAQQAMREIERQLDRAAELLTCMGSGIDQCPALLNEAAGCLRAIRHEYPFTPDDLTSLGPCVRRIQQKHVLVQDLLNSATSFYCGWLAAGTQMPGSYLPTADEGTNAGCVLIMEA